MEQCVTQPMVRQKKLLALTDAVFALKSHWTTRLRKRGVPVMPLQVSSFARLNASGYPVLSWKSRSRGTRAGAYCRFFLAMLSSENHTGLRIFGKRSNSGTLS